MTNAASSGRCGSAMPSARETLSSFRVSWVGVMLVLNASALSLEFSLAGSEHAAQYKRLSGAEGSSEVRQWLSGAPKVERRRFSLRLAYSEEAESCFLTGKPHPLAFVSWSRRFLECATISTALAERVEWDGNAVTRFRHKDGTVTREIEGSDPTVFQTAAGPVAIEHFGFSRSKIARIVDRRITLYMRTGATIRQDDPVWQKLATDIRNRLPGLEPRVVVSQDGPYWQFEEAPTVLPFMNYKSVRMGIGEAPSIECRVFLGKLQCDYSDGR